MQKWLQDNDKSVVAETFIKILRGKIYKRTSANDNKSYLSYLNKLVDEFDNSYYCLFCW